MGIADLLKNLAEGLYDGLRTDSEISVPGGRGCWHRVR